MTTDDPMDDARFVWGELYSHALRAGPRLEHWWGQCPSCELNASGAGVIGGLTWAYCATCRVRWLVVDLPPQLELADFDDETAYYFMRALSECIEIDDGQSVVGTITDRRESLTKHTVESYGIDPQHFQREKETLLLRSLTRAQRVGLTDLVLEVIGDHLAFHPISGSPRAQAHQIWQRIREHAIDPAGTTVSRALTVPGVSPVQELERLCALLLELRGKRELLERQLTLLDGIEAAFTDRSTGESTSRGRGTRARE